MAHHISIYSNQWYPLLFMTIDDGLFMIWDRRFKQQIPPCQVAWFFAALWNSAEAFDTEGYRALGLLHFGGWFHQQGCNINAIHVE